LLAQSGEPTRPVWAGEVDDFFHRAGVVICRVRSGSEAVSKVEQGGLSAAVLVEEGFEAVGVDVLSLIRIIRSIDQILPCWLVTRQTSRRTLEQALDLRVNSIIHYPTGMAELLAALRRVLSDPMQSN
jgi:DNA-binding response OmpR family regulator